MKSDIVNSNIIGRRNLMVNSTVIATGILSKFDIDGVIPQYGEILLSALTSTTQHRNVYTPIPKGYLFNIFGIMLYRVVLFSK